MSQLRIPFGLDGKTSSGGPAASWKNLILKPSSFWKVAFVEVNGKSYGSLLKPSQHHNIAMKISGDYQAHVYINEQSVLTDKHYIFGELVVSVNQPDVTINQLVDFVEETFYDH